MVPLESYLIKMPNKLAYIVFINIKCPVFSMMYRHLEKWAPFSHETDVFIRSDEVLF